MLCSSDLITLFGTEDEEEVCNLAVSNHHTAEILF